MDILPTTIISILRLRPRVPAGSQLAAPFVQLAATLSDGSRAVLFRARVNDGSFVDQELIGRTAHEAAAWAKTRGCAL